MKSRQVRMIQCRMIHLKHFIEFNNESSLRHKNVQPENRSLFSFYPEINLDYTTSKLTGSDSDSSTLLTNFIVNNNISAFTGVPSDDTLLRYLQDNPNQDHQSLTSGERPDDNSFF